MMTLERQARLIKQIYPTTIRRDITRFHSIYKPIKLNTTTRIVEMLPFYQKRIIKHKNKLIENRIDTVNKRKVWIVFCPMHYSKVLCHACYQEILPHYLYLSKNGEHGRSKYYHVNCAAEKSII